MREFFIAVNNFRDYCREYGPEAAAYRNNGVLEYWNVGCKV
jgi:hypothetical protein